MGYDVEKMTFSTEDGEIAEACFDVLLFSLLEQVPDIQEVFYRAHISGDTNKKESLRRKFYLETCIMLKTHVNKTLLEMEKLRIKIDQHDPKKHKLLPLIRENNAFVVKTFSKVRHRVDRMIKEELSARKSNKQNTAN